jgi:hypothetical protein
MLQKSFQQAHKPNESLQLFKCANQQKDEFFNKSLCAQAMSSSAHHSRDSLFYSNHAVALQLVNLKLEASSSYSSSESLPPSQS